MKSTLLNAFRTHIAFFFFCLNDQKETSIIAQEFSAKIHSIDNEVNFSEIHIYIVRKAKCA